MKNTSPNDWVPVARSEQLKQRPLLAVRAFDQDLLLFRMGNGSLGLLWNGCAHLGVTLEPGWVEADRVRCGYHGWAYDARGRCVDVPGEDGDWKDSIRLPAYPVQEAGGIIWAYNGDAEDPAFPPLDELLRAHPTDASSQPRADG